MGESGSAGARSKVTLNIVVTNVARWGSKKSVEMKTSTAGGPVKGSGGCFSHVSRRCNAPRPQRRSGGGRPAGRRMGLFTHFESPATFACLRQARPVCRYSGHVRLLLESPGLPWQHRRLGRALDRGPGDDAGLQRRLLSRGPTGGAEAQPRDAPPGSPLRLLTGARPRARAPAAVPAQAHRRADHG